MGKATLARSTGTVPAKTPAATVLSLMQSSARVGRRVSVRSFGVVVERLRVFITLEYTYAVRMSSHYPLCHGDLNFHFFVQPFLVPDARFTLPEFFPVLDRAGVQELEEFTV